MTQITEAQRFSDRNLIESIVSSYFIVDYGIITKVNDDKTVNVTHAKKQVLLDGSELPKLETPNLEVLTVSGSGFSLSFDYKKGDKVLLLGLKDYVKKTAEVEDSESPETFIHYARSTMKALPLCVFNDEAKVRIEVEKGKMNVSAEDDLTFTTDGKINLNGNDKQLVTWAELNNALQNLWSSIKSHTHNVATAGSATAQTGTAAASTSLAGVNLDISGAKTKTVLTGG